MVGVTRMDTLPSTSPDSDGETRLREGGVSPEKDAESLDSSVADACSTSSRSPIRFHSASSSLAAVRSDSALNHANPPNVRSTSRSISRKSLSSFESFPPI